MQYGWDGIHGPYARAHVEVACKLGVEFVPMAISEILGAKASLRKQLYVQQVLAHVSSTQYPQLFSWIANGNAHALQT